MIVQNKNKQTNILLTKIIFEVVFRKSADLPDDRVMHGRDVLPAESVELVPDFQGVLGLQKDGHPLQVSPVHRVLQRHDIESVHCWDA